MDYIKENIKNTENFMGKKELLSKLSELKRKSKIDYYFIINMIKKIREVELY